MPKDICIPPQPKLHTLSPHPIWTSCSSNPFEVNKATVQAALLSGRYRTDYLSRHWTTANPHGFCLLCPGKFLFGTDQHFLLHCEALALQRSKVIDLWSRHAEDDEHLHQHLKDMQHSSPISFWTPQWSQRQLLCARKD